MDGSIHQSTHRGALAAALALALCLLGIYAVAPATASAAAHTAATPASPGCVIHSLPSFIAQGEFATTATVADVIEVECNPFVYGTGAEVTITAAQLYSRCAKDLTWYDPNDLGRLVTGSGPSFSVHLDVDGNANVALIAGPKCMVGESLVTLDEDESPYETFTTSFAVTPDAGTPPGVTALPSSQVEDAESSAVVTIVEAEFARASEQRVRLASGQLYSRCQRGEKLVWVRADREMVPGPELDGEKAVELDDDGNGFALALGTDSCQEGPSLIEADLEVSPFTTVTTEFTVLPPQPTAEPTFTIEKLQQIDSAGGSFTTAPLTGTIGETVEYEIVVTNTSAVNETFTDFSDAHCDAGTIAGGPGSSELAPGAKTIWTCSHHLLSGGTYVNQASVFGGSVGGLPLKETSNQVEVTTPAPAPGFTIEKKQEIAGTTTGFTTATLTAQVGQTVDYEIRVTNTGNVALGLSGFSDPQCNGATIAGGTGGAPLGVGSSTTYTCSHLLTAPGSVVNVATVTGTPPGEPGTTKSSAPVEVVVASGESAFTITKRQRISGSGEPYSTAQLTGAAGAKVEYEIVVKNTGAVALTVASFSDPYCDAGTLAGGPGGSPLAPGSSTVYTCSHVLGSELRFTNVGTVSAGPTGAAPEKLSSNEVVVVVPAPNPGHGTSAAPTSKPGTPGGGVLAVCEVSRPVLHGLSGSERGPFTVSVSSNGIKQITFYLDGHKLKTLTPSQAKHGAFRLKINAHRLRAGLHRISFRTVMSNSVCAETASSRPFVRPKSFVSPSFTG